MRTVTISAPDGFEGFVDTPAGSRGYGGSSVYLRELVRKDQDHPQLRGLRMGRTW